MCPPSTPCDGSVPPSARRLGSARLRSSKLDSHAEEAAEKHSGFRRTRTDQHKPLFSTAGRWGALCTGTNKLLSFIIYHLKRSPRWGCTWGSHMAAEDTQNGRTF
ncbi:hypothetical protein ATANTOWER_007909 [Ataeniobius toweri]|uniref:Uncharacterized protein n=1 Tax=Ataeniobius toweri TaxID=208326 RepID=A0ABU7BWZ4_9TELE|nr:hypothetical protein [Ataeniobius toweri]